MSGTVTDGLKTTAEELQRLKREELERYERLHRMETFPEDGPQAQPRVNRKLRRKIAAVNRRK